MVDSHTDNPDAPQSMLRIALAHDWLCGVRGGEHVLERIARIIAREHESAGLFVMFNDGAPIGPNVDAMSVRASWLNALPGSRLLRRWLLPLYPSAVESLSRRLQREHDRAAIDLLISTSSAAIKGLRPPPGVPHLCYCHSPARYVWSQERAAEHGARGLGLRLFGGWFRAWDRMTASRVTAFIANSQHTAAEIERCYARTSVVVHPPVREFFFELPLEQRAADAPWLVVSALEPYKRIDLAIDAAIDARHELIIVGDGSQRQTLEQRAAGHSNVRFVGRQSDEELRGWYSRAALLLFPQVEDFGIVALEAQACGLAVVARRAGGALETVVEGRTGAFFDGENVVNVLAAVGACPGGREADCRAHAEAFREQRFDARLREIIAATVVSH